MRLQFYWSRYTLPHSYLNRHVASILLGHVFRTVMGFLDTLQYTVDLRA
jgi:hypothetical protein